MSDAYRSIALRELAPGDLDALTAMLGNPVVSRFRLTGPLERDEVALLLEQAIADQDVEPRQRFRFAITREEDGAAIGSIALELDRFTSCYTHSSFLHPGFQGRHVGRNALRLVHAFAFERLDVHRVWGAVVPENTAAVRMVSATGMTLEGRIRDAWFKDGASYDLDTYAIHRSDWARLSTQPVADLAMVG